jgi:hypothetical protein
VNCIVFYSTIPAKKAKKATVGLCISFIHSIPVQRYMRYLNKYIHMYSYIHVSQEFVENVCNIDTHIISISGEQAALKIVFMNFTK